MEPSEASLRPPRLLEGRIALIAGATRGAGRAIAVELGRAGAHVVVTGRSTREAASEMGRPETIEDTADMVRAAGGTATARRVDHTRQDEVRDLIECIDHDHGRLDILVNDVWGGDHLMQMGPFWEQDLSRGLRMFELGAVTHLITSRHAVPLMVRNPGRGGIVFEITDGIADRYRDTFYYDLTKNAVVRAAKGQAHDLFSHGIAVLAVGPGFLRSEAMLDHFGVTEETWRDAIAQDPHFAISETPYFVARCIAALAADPDIMARTGTAVASWNLAREYGIDDVDGHRPDWGTYARDVLGMDMG